MDRKKEIRAKILKMRQALPKEEVREKSLRIMRRIEETETFKNADNLLAYIDFCGEVATGTLIEKAWQSCREVFLMKKRTVSVMAVDFMIVILKNGKISAGSQLLMKCRL